MKNIHRILCLLGTVLALMLCAVPAYAAKGTTADLDLTKKGSIPLTLKDSDGNAMTGGFLDCIQVAEIADNDCFGKGDELLNNVLINIGKWNIEQSVIDDYVAKLTKFYYGENS